MDIKIYPDPVLFEDCEEVSVINDDFIAKVNEMIETMRNADGIGLAAPQVGILGRFFVCLDFSTEERLDSLVLINPVITEKKGRVESKEGCLSIPGFYEYVYRYEEIEVKALDLKGKEIVYCPTGLQSVVFQHEYDHLDGILFPERMNSITKDIFMKKINKEFK